MLRINIKKILTDLIIVLAIFSVDRLSKVYILKMAELEGIVNIYITKYLNFYLIWNKGVAFGLFSFNESFVYNLITSIIITVTIVILIMMDWLITI